MTIYLDVVLIENLCMNFIILFATSYLLKIKSRFWRLLISSFIGGAYAILAYMEIFEAMSNVFVKVILSIVMVGIAFLPKNVKILLKQLAIFYFISFLFGGCAFALLYFIKPQDILMKNGLLVGMYPLKVAVLGGLVGFIVVGIVFKIVKTKFTKKDMFCDIEVHAFEGKIKTRALIDTGNLLKDPLTKMPVIVVEEEILSCLLPNNILKNIGKIMGGEQVEESEENLTYMSKFRVIPFSSLGKQNGMLMGFKADSIVVEEQREMTNVIIGVYPQKLDKKEYYHALIGLDILEGSKEENEYIANTSK